MTFRDLVDRILVKATDAMGETVTFYPGTDEEIEVPAIFDSEYQVLDPDTEQVLSANQPGLGVNLNDFETDPKQGDIVQVRETKYRVTDTREDGQGGAVLLLNKVTASDRPKHPRTR